jgi:vitamin B12 transporter
MKNVFLSLILILNINLLTAKADKLPDCKWDNRGGIPCINITKTNNTSEISATGINKIIISKQDIEKSGVTNVNDLLKTVSGLDVYQNGPSGQLSSVFTRGAESNHTLVLLNGIAINDQSTTDGLHDFGQDFIQTIQQIEIYKGSSGAQFGPSAIAGAINFITAVDYTNRYSVSGFNGRNTSFDGNYTSITENGWHLNIKGTANQSDTNSAKAAGSENDDSSNFQINLNAEKWINDNTKIKSTIYSRKTRSKYDNSATDEEGYVADNIMYALQSGVNRVYEDKENNLIIHYHSYDRDYKNSGHLDEYNSESLTIKGERKINSNENLSFGFGSEYKYDWGKFENRGSYKQSMKGHIADLGLFANAGYKLSDDTILSLYGRFDDHKTTGFNETYKVNLTKVIKNFKIGASHSTGLRNPSLYELYGSADYNYKGNRNLDAEKSSTNEIFASYELQDNLTVKSTVYRATIFDRIEQTNNYRSYENKKLDLNQEGLESELIFNRKNQKISLFTNFSKSKTTGGDAQLRRPDITHGANYYQKFNSSLIGIFDMNLNYKFTGKHWDISSGNVKVKSTNIVNLLASKNLNNTIFKVSISNLLNERYERPITYSQDGRQLRLGFSRNF